VSVYLPPGYHEPANRNLRYPVVFFLHGYGMEPQQLVATGLIVGNFMSGVSLPTWRRPQKFIMVFPDGRCRQPDGCIRGTFYTDSPVGNAQMERYFLDLYDHIDRSYRVRAPETLEVVE
jgi:predicted esterase